MTLTEFQFWNSSIKEISLGVWITAKMHIIQPILANNRFEMRVTGLLLINLAMYGFDIMFTMAKGALIEIWPYSNAATSVTTDTARKHRA